jgi:hypothetical protein
MPFWDEFKGNNRPPGREHHYAADTMSATTNIGLLSLEASLPEQMPSMPPSNAALEEAEVMAYELADIVETHSIMRRNGQESYWKN